MSYFPPPRKYTNSVQTSDRITQNRRFRLLKLPDDSILRKYLISTVFLKTSPCAISGSLLRGVYELFFHSALIIVPSL